MSSIGIRARILNGSLVDRASRLSPPKAVAPKDPKDFKLIGRSTKRLDTPSKVDGTAVFGLDVTLPGMLVALVARPPVFGGKAKMIDDARARAVPGVRHIVEIDRGVAVVAECPGPPRRGARRSGSPGTRGR